MSNQNEEIFQDLKVPCIKSMYSPQILDVVDAVPNELGNQ